MRMAWLIGVFVLPFTLFEASAAPNCPTGYQPRGDICLGQIMIEYLACVDATGGNKQEVYDTIASAINTETNGDITVAGSGFVIKGSGSTNVDKKTEEQIQKSLSTKFYGEGTTVCLRVLDKISPTATPPIEPPKTAPAPPATVTFRICSGEYERACQQHDVYLYCYSDVNAWAQQKCSSYSVTRYTTYGGNKCGYGMDLVTCVGPK